MKVDKNTKKQISLEHDTRISKAVQSVLKGDMDSAKQNIEQVNILKQILDTQEKYQKIKWSGLLTMAILIIVGISMSLRVPRTRAYLDLIADGIAISLEDKWQISKLVADEYRMNNLELYSINGYPLDLIDLGNQRNSDASYEIHLNGKKVYLVDLEVPEKTLIELATQKNQFILYLKRASLAGRFRFKSAIVEILEDGTTKERLEKRNTLSDVPFRTIYADHYSEPTKIHLKNNIRFDFDALRAGTVRFEQEHPPNSGKFVSTVKSGKIRLYETGEEIKINASDSLIIEIQNSRPIKIELSNDGIHVAFEAELSKIKCGPRDFERDYKPRFLEYVYHNKPLALLWGAVIFLWGFLWNIRDKTYKWLNL